MVFEYMVTGVGLVAQSRRRGGRRDIDWDIADEDGDTDTMKIPLQRSRSGRLLEDEGGNSSSDLTEGKGTPSEESQGVYSPLLPPLSRIYEVQRQLFSSPSPSFSFMSTSTSASSPPSPLPQFNARHPPSPRNNTPPLIPPKNSDRRHQIPPQMSSVPAPLPLLSPTHRSSLRLSSFVGELQESFDKVIDKYEKWEEPCKEARYFMEATKAIEGSGNLGLDGLEFGDFGRDVESALDNLTLRK